MTAIASAGVRAPEQEALGFLAAEPLQRLQLPLGLDTLGDHGLV